MYEKDIRIENLEKQVEKLTKDKENIEHRLSNVEKSSAVTSEQVKMIFNILKEIKDSISAISKKLDVLEQEPAIEAKQLRVATITAFITGIIGVMVGFLFKK